MGTRAMAAVVALALVHCGGKESTTSSGSETPTAANAPSASGGPRSAGKIPDQIDDLAAVVPADAAVVVATPGFAGLPLPKPIVEQMAGALAGELARRAGVPEASLKSALEAVDQAVLFDTKGIPEGDSPVVVAARFKDASAGEALLKDLALEKSGDAKYVKKRPNGDLHFAWLASSKVLVASNDDAALDASLGVLAGAAPSFATSPNAKKREAAKPFVFLDIHKVGAGHDDVAGLGSFAALSLGASDTNVSLVLNGDKIPRLGRVLATTTHGALAKLPAGAPIAIDLSLARQPGKTLKDLAAEIARAAGEDPSSHIDAALGKLAGGLTLADVDKALGDSAALAVYLPAEGGAPGGRDPLRASNVVMRIAVSDHAIAEKLFDAAKKASPTGGKHSPVWSTDQVVIEQGERTIIVRLEQDAVVAALGEKKACEALLKDYADGKNVFGATQAYADFKAKAAASNLTIYADLASLAKALPGEGLDQLGGGSTAAVDLVLAPSSTGIDVSFGGSGATSVIGAGSALAIYGVQKYLKDAKAAEAKNTISAIARGAVGAYERETGAAGAHALCKTAKPAPAIVPAGRKEIPDFESGSEDTGWKCLRFTVTNPVYFQYEYRAGGPYKCVARGGDDPGPNGFEVSAEGDLDGNGKTSLYCLTGKVVGGAVKVSTELKTIDEGE